MDICISCDDSHINRHSRDIHKMDKYIMHEALEIAKKSDMRSKHGCIIIDNKGNIISSACNKTINISSETCMKRNFDKGVKISRHAEENALRNVDQKKLYGARLYVVRWGVVSSNPTFMNSKPCDRCTKIINSCMKKFGLKVAYYSSD